MNIAILLDRVVCLCLSYLTRVTETDVWCCAKTDRCVVLPSSVIISIWPFLFAVRDEDNDNWPHRGQLEKAYIVVTWVHGGGIDVVGGWLPHPTIYHYT